MEPPRLNLGSGVEVPHVPSESTNPLKTHVKMWLELSQEKTDKKGMKEKFPFISKVNELRTLEACVAVAGTISPTDLLHKISEILNATKTDFAVAGGFARSVHAAPRMTSDLDIVVATKDRKAVEKILLDNGFEKRDVLEYQKPKRTLAKFVHQGRELDILDFPGHPEFSNFLVSTRVEKNLGNVKFFFVSVEGLILTKLCSFRNKDKGDLEDLMETSPTIDLGVIKSWCSDLGIMDRFSFLQDLLDGKASPK